MKIINAVWEKRNLGCDAYEITLDNKDLKDFETTLKQIREQNFSNSYVVIKMPVGNLRALHALEDEGFRFMEVSFNIGRSLENYTAPEILELNDTSLIREEISKEKIKWEKIVNLITPDMFTTDRIYLDSLLASGTSCKRYQNWIMDLCEKDGFHLYAYKRDKDIIGYGVDFLDNNKKVVHGILGGIFAPFKNEGLGCYLWHADLEAQSRDGYKETKTTISSNNAAIMRLYMAFDYKIQKQTYVLRKMYKGEK